MPPKAPDRRLREAMMEAMLAASAELGYRAVTVEDVLERYGGNRAQFYRHFPNLGECFLAAYREEVSRLCEGMLRAAAAAASWHEGLHDAIQILVTFVVERPLVARALTIDVQLAGEPAQEVRKEMYERLSRAVDSARRETGSRHSPPPLTALFMVSAIDAAVAAALARGEPESFAEAAPELEHLVVVAYFGE